MLFAAFLGLICSFDMLAAKACVRAGQHAFAASTAWETSTSRKAAKAWHPSR